MHCRLFSSTPSLYSLDAGTTLPPKLKQPKISPDIAKCSLRGKISQLKTTGSTCRRASTWESFQGRFHEASSLSLHLYFILHHVLPLQRVSPAVTQMPMASSLLSHGGVQRTGPPLKLYGFFQFTWHCLLWFLKALVCRPFIQQTFSEPSCTAVPCLEDQEEASTELRSTMS